MEKTQVVEIDAQEAKRLTEQARSEGYKKAMVQINTFATMGMAEAPLLGIGLNMSDVEKLMKNGFSVSTFQNAHDSCTFYKVSW